MFMVIKMYNLDKWVPVFAGGPSARQVRLQAIRAVTTSLDGRWPCDFGQISDDDGLFREMSLW